MADSMDIKEIIEALQKTDLTNMGEPEQL